MQISITYTPSEYVYKMEHLDNGVIINYGGRSLPF